MIDATRARAIFPYALRYKLVLFFLVVAFCVLGYRAVELAIASPLPPSVIDQGPKIRRGVIFDSRG
ncbi:MAG: hypothetical protein N2Z22_11935, partial [Turneriella sp.]|nr:hypothetical protein [Turneriella sp.]